MVVMKPGKDPLPTIDGHVHDVIEDYDIVEADPVVQFRSQIRIAPVGGAGGKLSAIQHDFNVPAWNYIAFDAPPVGDVTSETEAKITLTMRFDREEDGAGIGPFCEVRFFHAGGKKLNFVGPDGPEDFIAPGTIGIKKYVISVDRADAEGGLYPLVLKYGDIAEEYSYVFLDPN